MYFSATIFELLHFSSPTLTSLSVASTNFLFTIVAFYLIDRIGRRRTLLLTIPIMAIALLLCAASFMLIEVPPGSPAAPSTSPPPTHPPAKGSALAILASLLLYVAAYATGLGPVPWQQSEMFPLAVRSLGSSFATATNWGSNTIVGLTFLPMMQYLTPGWTFVCYAAICVGGWFVVHRIYPETMGLGLEEVGELLAEGWGVDRRDGRVREMGDDS
jgi:MFS transporter, SP family, solute carrier family 2 (myo-inositol transporter), member 13